MYTRCPSCRSEITFEPPANMDSLPEGYKHRIKCPCCGVTIGVKLNKPVADVVQPTFVPQNPYATSAAPVYNAGTAEGFNPDSREEKKLAKAEKKAASGKKTGIPRNIMMFIISLLIIAINVFAYLTIEVPYCDGFNQFDGIGCIANAINDFEAFKASFAGDNLVNGILALLPAVVFIFACIQALVALIALFGNKYSRAFNFIWSLLIAAAAVVNVFAPVILGADLVNYFVNDVLANEFYGLFIAAGIAILGLLFALIFCKSMKKKVKKA